MNFYEARYDFPMCNHTEGVSENNIGYSIGITEDGIPFEAEAFLLGDMMVMAVVLPDLLEDIVKRDVKTVAANVIGFREEAEQEDLSVLDIGMVDDGEETDLSVTQKYVEFLLERGIFEYTSNLLNGAVEYRTDILGNRLVKVIITLSENDIYMAYTTLDFRPFQKTRESKVIRLEDHRR